VSVSRLTGSILGVLYLSFFSWYTSFGGPLSPEEVEHYVALMAEQNPDGTPERRAMMRAFLESDTGDDFVMWNTMEMHATPLQVDGVEPGETSMEVLAKYMEYMWPALLRRACHPVFMAQAAGPSLEMFGMDGARNWSQGAGMRYRSRRDLMQIATNPEFQGSHDFKIAAMAKTFAFPGDPWFHMGDPRLLLALIFLVIGLGVSRLSVRSARGSARNR
jgi:hypothetical protein